ncbi:hypothetical protein [Pseudoalteromonas sp. B62]|uniref:hypothetical protein n=1 Tax=Pseudoalteromonas sp. B62 TaxID=630483 RepID=UPI00301C9660
MRGKQKDIPWNDTGLKSHYITSSSSKIIGALDYIKAISESCYTTLKDSIFTIAIRFDNTKDKFNCASTNICNGLIILINPHLDNVSIETVADAIVHEMIHNLFDVAELYEPCLPTKFHPRIIESPWTKRMLDPNTYIQACYTWYGLKCFWQKAHECEKSQNAYYYLQQSSKGFASSEFIDVAKNSEFEFDQKIISTLERFKISGC